MQNISELHIVLAQLDTAIIWHSTFFKEFILNGYLLEGYSGN